MSIPNPLDIRLRFLEESVSGVSFFLIFLDGFLGVGDYWGAEIKNS